MKETLQEFFREIIVSFSNRNSRWYWLMAGILVSCAVMLIFALDDFVKDTTVTKKQLSSSPNPLVEQDLQSSPFAPSISSGQQNAPPTSTDLRSERLAAEEQSKREFLEAQTAAAEKIAIAKVDAAKDDLSKIETKLEALKGRLKSLLSQMEDLLTNEAGSRIASSQSRIDDFRSIRELSVGLENDLSPLERDAKNMDTELEPYRLRPTVKVIPNEFSSKIRSLQDKLAKLDSSLRQRELALATLVRDSSSATGNISLAKAIDQMDLQRIQKDIAAVSAGVKEEEEKGRAAMAAAEKEAAKKKAEEELQKYNEEIARKQLEADFQNDLPKINRYLGTLFIKGSSQPGRSIAEQESTGTDHPISLTGLRRIGALSDNVQHACLILQQLFTHSKTYGRGAGPYAFSFGDPMTESQFRELRTAHELLKKYGDLLVKKKMLAE